jgi:hypothetical protein
VAEANAGFSIRPGAAGIGATVMQAVRHPVDDIGQFSGVWAPLTVDKTRNSAHSSVRSWLFLGPMQPRTVEPMIRAFRTAGSRYDSGCWPAAKLKPGKKRPHLVVAARALG